MPISYAVVPKMAAARAARTDRPSLRTTIPTTQGTLRAQFAADRRAVHGSVASGFGKPSTAEHVTAGPASG